jgi:hypothetical protein
MYRTRLVSLLLLFPVHRHKIPILIAGNPLPPRAKALLTRIEARENMCLGIKHDLIERQQLVGAE